MNITVQSYGAAGEVTGSSHLLTIGDHKVLIDCGLIQGNAKSEERNRLPFGFDIRNIDAVIMTHAHIDHSGRIPLLIKRGYKGPLYAHSATVALCKIMLRDAASLNEKDTEWENRKRERKGLELLEPLYTPDEAALALDRVTALEYHQAQEILPGVELRFFDAGHILGSSISQISVQQPSGKPKVVIFTGDLGRSGMPILRDPETMERADWVIMESTYGNRLHRSWQDTMAELASIFKNTITTGKGNILIPAFAVGRTQDILYLFARHYKEWGLDRWHVFLDSPLAIEATEVYARHSRLFDEETLQMWSKTKQYFSLPNLHFSRTSEQSMELNRVRAGAIIIAGSGMCNGGRIKHHLKHNAWRHDCHIIIPGYQAIGTPGRALVDGARFIRLWGEAVSVAATIHTVGGLSAHADQAGLSSWYGKIPNRPQVILVHGEEEALTGLSEYLTKNYKAQVTIARPNLEIKL